MDYEFDRAVAVTPAGEGEYAAELDAGWVVGGGLNGGYLLSVIGTAIRAEVGDSGQADPATPSLCNHCNRCMPTNFVGTHCPEIAEGSSRSAAWGTPAGYA